MKLKEDRATTVEAPGWWDRAKAGAARSSVLTVVVVGVVIASAVSYGHEDALARYNGQADWAAALVPFTVDGILLAAAIALLWASNNGVRGWQRLWRPRAELLVGILATIAANLFSDLHARWLGPAVAASAGLAVFLLSDVAFWLVGEQRRVDRGDTSQRASNCSCPPPPVTLAQALVLARAQLLEDGERHGEEALADRFSVSRHQVRTALASMNGNGPHD